MGVAGVYEVVAQQFNADLLAKLLLPSVLSILVDKSLNVEQVS